MTTTAICPPNRSIGRVSLPGPVERNGMRVLSRVTIRMVNRLLRTMRLMTSAPILEVSGKISRWARASTISLIDVLGKPNFALASTGCLGRTQQSS